MPLPITKQEFLRRLYAVHGGKYSIDPDTAIDKLMAKYWVTCPEHGDWQAWGHHLLGGKGCPDCYIARAGKKFWEVIIDRGWDKHYDLSAVNFTTTRAVIQPVCRVHGSISVRADFFEAGKGCKACGHVKLPR
jgi:hypothetical protein